MRTLCVWLLICCMVPAGWAQVSKMGPAAKALVAQTPKAVSKNISSKLLQARYLLSVQAVETLQQVHAQQMLGLLMNEGKNPQDTQASIDNLHQEAANTLARLTQQMNQEYAQWAAALLRERNPRFLPPKKAQMPGLLSTSPQPEKVPHLTQRAFREWAEKIPLKQDLPDEVNGLVFALRQKLVQMETKTYHWMKQYMQAQAKIDPTDHFNANRYYRKQMAQARRELLRLSTASAQTVTDLVHLLKLYPDTYQQNLSALAYKLENSLQTPFTSYLRSELVRFPPRSSASQPVQIKGFRAGNASAQQIQGIPFH